jgi:polysaccharide export outer membrane protein
MYNSKTTKTGVRNVHHFKTLANILIILSIGIVTACSTTSDIDTGVMSSSSKANSEYQIGPGDTLQVYVWRNPDISVTVPVRPDGYISTPLVEDIQAINKTPSQLARDIEKRLSKYIRDPVVTVIVTNFVGTYSKQIRVIGEATKPQALPYRENMTLLDVMIAVGGLTDFAAGNSAKLIRTQGGKTTQIEVHLKDLLQDGDISANKRVLPGDIILIPQSIF